MNAKTVLLLLLGMSLSFGATCYVMYSVLVPDTPRAAPRRAARAPRPVAPAPERPIAPSGQVVRGTAVKPQPPAGGPDATAAAVPSAASPQIAQLRQQLDQQILRMKQERDQMLGELARQLTAMPATQAAAQLAQVDDEVAALALGRMPAAPRQAILTHLDPRRARSLNPPR